MEIDGDSTCLICLEASNADFQLDCGHLFHFKCIKKSLKHVIDKDRCPYCRKKTLNIVEDVVENTFRVGDMVEVNACAYNGFAIITKCTNCFLWVVPYSDESHAHSGLDAGAGAKVLRVKKTNAKLPHH